MRLMLAAFATFFLFSGNPTVSLAQEVVFPGGRCVGVCENAKGAVAPPAGVPSQPNGVQAQSVDPAQTATLVSPSPTPPTTSKSQLDNVLGVLATPVAPSASAPSQPNDVQAQNVDPAQTPTQVSPSPTPPTSGDTASQSLTFPGGTKLQLTRSAAVSLTPAAERKLELKTRKVKLFRVIPQGSGTATANPFEFASLEIAIGKASKTTPLILVNTTFPVEDDDDDATNLLYLAIDPNGNGSNTFRWVESTSAVSGQAMTVAGLGNNTGNIFNAGQFTLVSPSTGAVISNGSNKVILRRSDGIFFTVTFDFEDEGEDEGKIRSSTGTNCGDRQTSCP